jgi:hypothetical protein
MVPLLSRSKEMKSRPSARKSMVRRVRLSTMGKMVKKRATLIQSKEVADPPSMSMEKRACLNLKA